jgi:hypothetical protein
MAAEWNVVTFNEGAPFDPNDLNQLQLNLTNVFTKSTTLLNATKDSSGTSRVAITDQGSASIVLKGTTPASTTVTFTPSFTAGTDTGFVASMGQALTSTTGNVSVSAVINSDKTGGTIYAVSSKATTSTINVNWIATQLKDISA